MKTFVKSLLCRSVAALPLRAQKLILAELARNVENFEAAGDMARRMGFTGFVADGDAGTIRGAVDDNSVLVKYAREHSWAPRERSLFKELFAERGGTYLDIGANIGLTVIPIAQMPQVECFAFEPEPNNFRYLSENIAVNCHNNNVRLLNLALFDKDTTVLFEISVRHSGDHRISLNESNGLLSEGPRQRISVAAKRLDDLVMDVAKPLAAKIDVQGAEPFVVAGGQRTLSQADLISMEFWPYSMHRMGGDVSELINFLTENFQEGSISAGDKDEAATWKTIGETATYLRSYASSNLGRPLEYLDVEVRKA